MVFEPKTVLRPCPQVATPRIRGAGACSYKPSPGQNVVCFCTVWESPAAPTHITHPGIPQQDLWKLVLALIHVGEERKPGRTVI